MKLIIDIPEDIYEASQSDDKDYIKMMSDEICTALNTAIQVLESLDKIKSEIADRLGLLDCKKDILAIIDKYIGDTE